MAYLTVEEIGELARTLRKEAGLSQLEAAERVSSTQSNISAAEAGSSTRYVGVALSMIAIIGRKHVTGPYYKVEDVMEG